MIGRGSYGTVFKGTYARPGGDVVNVAVKVLETTSSATASDDETIRKVSPIHLHMLSSLYPPHANSSFRIFVKRLYFGDDSVNMEG